MNCAFATGLHKLIIL